MQDEQLQQPDPILNESRDRFSDLSEFSPVGYLMLSRTAVIERVNSNAAALLGVEYNELLQHRFEQFVSDESLAGWHRYFENVIRNGEQTDCELLLRRGGASFYARLESMGMVVSERATSIRLRLTDVTEQKLAEEVSVRLLHRNQMLMSTSLDGIHVMDIRGNLLEANDAFCKMLGYTQEEITHLNVAEWDAQLTAEELRLAYKKTMGQSAVIETVHRRKDGSLISVEVSITGSRFEGEDYIFASSRDITERKRIASSLEETTRLLRELVAKHESSLEEERKAIAREVHDELGQILTSLRMDISVMRIRFGQTNAELMEIVKNMSTLADRALHGVRNVAENLRPVALDIGIVSALEWLCNNFTARTGVSCVLHAPDEFIDLDNSRAIVLFRLVQESLTNVMRHAEASSVAVAVSLDEDDLCLEVRDNGKGFNAGAPGKRKSYGLLGMSERARSLDGTVEIDSEEGKGTTVTVHIPVNATGDA